MIEVGKVVNSKLNYVNKNYTSYSYDNLNRLESENYIAFTGGSPSTMWSESYNFDDNNNALTKSHDDIFDDSNDTVTTNTYDDCNKITSQVKRNYNNVIVNDYDFTYD